MAASNFQRELLARRESQIALALDFGVIVPKSDGSKRDQPGQRDPYSGHVQLGPQQRRDHDRGADQQAAHGRSAGFLVVRLRSVFPNVLADLEFAQTCDEPRTEQHEDRHSGQTRHGRTKSRVLKNSKRRKEVIQVFVSEPVKHGSASAPFPGGEKLLQRALHVYPARALEQDCIPGLRERAHQLAGWDGIVEKKCGVGP